MHFFWHRGSPCHPFVHIFILPFLFHKGSGIIYCRTREGCQELAGRLSSSGIVAKAYHAGKLLLVTIDDTVQCMYM